MKIINLILIMLMIISVTVGDVFATTYAKTSLKKFVETSTIIVNATVIESVSSWNDEHNNIYTHTRVKINEVYKGKDLPDEIVIEQLGGRVGDKSLEIESSPQFKVNEKTLLFLIYFNDKWVIHSIGMGKFDLVEDSGKLVAINPRISQELIESDIKYKDANAKCPKFLMSELKNKIEIHDK